MDIPSLESLDSAPDRKTASSEVKRVSVPLPSTPTHLAVNCEQLVLAVVLQDKDTPRIYFYDVRAFADGNDPASIMPFNQVRDESAKQWWGQFNGPPC